MTDGFTAAPFSSAARGQTVTLLSPAMERFLRRWQTELPAPGTPPASLPSPKLPVKLTVGGQTAAIVFVGIPSGLWE